MKIRAFRRGYRNGWELNFVGRKWNLRIARYQIGFWRNYEPIFNLVAQ